MDAVIKTDRLRLRQWRPEDVEPFDRFTNTQNVMRWLGGVQTREKIAEVINRLTGWQEERGFTFWAVERKADAALLGFCGIKIADGPGSSVTGEHEIGWRLREDAWGQGYAREAATASLDHAFDVLGAERVIALTVVENSASWGLMERLGMHRRPDLDYDDPRYPELNPVIIYAIERGEWNR